MQTRTRIQLVGAALAAAIGSFLGLGDGVAHAHFNLMMPPAADNATDGGKGAPPCGPTAASGVVTPAQGGHPLTIMLTETVGHPGHYRFALSINARTELPADPVAVVQGGLSVSAPVESPAVFPVLADGVFDHPVAVSGAVYQTTVTLPNVTCAKCTLQVIEFMAQHGANTGGGYYYHHCADLQITADPNLPAFGGGNGAGGATGAAGNNGAADSGTGGSAPASSSGGCVIEGGRPLAQGSAAIVLLALMTAARRRRRR
jgi:hypothetical protein